MTARSRPRVVVLGDSVLDVWLCGRTGRLSREGPVPVVEVDHSSGEPGSAANTAANLAALGADVDLVTAVGRDEAGKSLIEHVSQYGVGVEHVLVVAGWTTPLKQRLLCGDRVVARWDLGGGRPLGADHTGLIAQHVIASHFDADALVICDYTRTVADSRVEAALRRLRRTLPLVVVDAHELDRWSVLRPDVVTPNAAEAAALLVDHCAVPRGSARFDYFTEHCQTFLDKSGAKTVALTLDRDGSLVLEKGRPPHRTKAHPAPEEQCVGAGDTFTAAMTIALLEGCDSAKAADFAQRAANVVTAKSGTAVCRREDTEPERRTPILTEPELLEIVATHRRAGRRIVFTNGCFDVLHRGHVKYLDEARAAGDVLIVAINSDSSVTALKGPDRPINRAADRAAVLNALACVDHVIVFDGPTPVPLLQRIRPDIYVKGGDYSVEMLSEASVVQDYGGDVRIMGYVAEHSTSETIRRIRGDGNAGRIATVSHDGGKATESN